MTRQNVQFANSPNGGTVVDDKLRALLAAVSSGTVSVEDALGELRVAQTDFHALPAHLSLGVRKRVSLARALVLDPNFVFFDDPDAGLDAPTRALVYKLLERFRDDPKITMVVASNSRPLIERMAVQIVELTHGHLLKRVGSQSPNSRGPSY